MSVPLIPSVVSAIKIAVSTLKQFEFAKLLEKAEGANVDKELGLEVEEEAAPIEVAILAAIMTGKYLITQCMVWNCSIYYSVLLLLLSLKIDFIL